MTLTEYVHNHLIDINLMSRAEVSDLITSIYNQLAKTGYNHSRDAKLIDLLIDLELSYNTNELIIPKFTI